MSGLPIMSVMNSAPVYLKTGAVAAIGPPVTNDTAATKTLTTMAVQQLRQGDSAPAVARSVLPQEKRARLVGPPPAFEVNVLQHMKEMRDQDALGQTDAGFVTRPTGQDAGGEDTAPAYGFFSATTADAPPPATVNKVL